MTDHQAAEYCYQHGNTTRRVPLDWRASAISYLRVSTDKQGIDGYGIEAQRQAIRTLLNGSAPLMEFIEQESGKATANRLQLEAAWKACKAKKATLVVARLDRLSRSVHDISGWLAAGYDFRCADMPERNPFMIHVYAAFAEEERRKIAERTKLAMQAARDQRGKRFGAAANPVHGARLAAQNRARAIEAAEVLRPRIEALRAAGIDRQHEIAAALGLHVTQVARVMRRLRAASGDRQGAETPEASSAAS